MAWHVLPRELRDLILEAVVEDGDSVTEYATVSREWQMAIERYNFSCIKVTPSRVAQFESMTRRNRSNVHFIWLCLELEDYDCTRCRRYEQELYRMSVADDVTIMLTVAQLFQVLSTWEPNGKLVLDLDVYSPSDSKHWFQYLTFEPDDAFVTGGGLRADQSMPANANTHELWLDGIHPYQTWPAIEKVFAPIMGRRRHGMQWSDSLWPDFQLLVPAITGVVLRSQTRRRWPPHGLAIMFRSLPRLQEIHYEPWRGWYNGAQKNMDDALEFFFLSMMPLAQLRKLVVFENFNEVYPARFCYGDPVRTPCPYVGWAAAEASLTLEHLSLSFLVDARDFFGARKRSWRWPKLTQLALTTHLFEPGPTLMEVDSMLYAAATAARKMPVLETMEIWSGRMGLAMLFRYQRPAPAQPAVITLRGLWVLSLHPAVIRAWRDVAESHRGEGVTIVEEILGTDAPIMSHGDALQQLNLSTSVIRPVSLRQIHHEYRYREQWTVGRGIEPMTQQEFAAAYLDLYGGLDQQVTGP